MFTTASRVYLGMAAVALVGFVVYAGFVGGDRTGDALLVLAGLAFLGGVWVTTAVRVPDLARPVADTPIERRPVPDPGTGARPSTWPVVVALGAGLLAVGLAVGSAIVLLASVVALAGLGGWMAQVWREHPSWTPRVGDKVSTRVVSPFALPLSAALVAVVMVGSVSRILLTITEDAAVMVSILVATLVFAGCAVAATRPRVTARALGAMTGVALVTLVSAGVVSGLHGPREEEEHRVAVAPVEIVASGTAFQQRQVMVPGDRIQLTFVNADAGTYHNVSVYSEREGGKPFLSFRPFPGSGRERYPPVDLREAGLVPGHYYFRCDFHPAMVGDWVVTADKAPPGTPNANPEEHGAAKTGGGGP